MVALCRVCQRVQARYTCPRCEAVYCGLGCYREHGAQCTESFYKAQVEAELRSRSATGEERRCLERIVQELGRLGEEPCKEGRADKDEEADSEEERLEALAERARQGDLSVEDLSEEEARRFHAELASGSLGRALGAWEPWWQWAAVVELDTLDDQCAPRVPRAHLCCTPSRSVSPLVAITVLEALYAYAHTMRSFNGDWAWDPLQAASHLLHIAKAVATQRVYQTVGECFHAVRSAASALPGGGYGAAFDVLCLHDVSKLLTRQGDSLVRALLEAAEILSKARELALQERNSAKALNGLLRSAKKLEFLAAFADHHEEILAPVAAEVQSVVMAHEGYLVSMQPSKDCREHDGIALPLRD